MGQMLAAGSLSLVEREIRLNTASKRPLAPHRYHLPLTLESPHALPCPKPPKSLKPAILYAGTTALQHIAAEPEPAQKLGTQGENQAMTMLCTPCRLRKKGPQVRRLTADSLQNGRETMVWTTCLWQSYYINAIRLLHVLSY
jgi:hypothetical protein